MVAHDGGWAVDIGDETKSGNLGSLPANIQAANDAWHARFPDAPRVEIPEQFRADSHINVTTYDFTDGVDRS